LTGRQGKRNEVFHSKESAPLMRKKHWQGKKKREGRTKKTRGQQNRHQMREKVGMLWRNKKQCEALRKGRDMEKKKGKPGRKTFLSEENRLRKREKNGGSKVIPRTVMLKEKREKHWGEV